MTVTQSQFVQDFPEFADSTKYPVAMINLYLNIANSFDPNKWQQYLTLGVELYTAHHLVMRGRAKRNADFGGDPGATTGPTMGKNVAGLQRGYDTGSATVAGAGHWNNTEYGVEFFQLCLMVGMGGLQIGALDRSDVDGDLGFNSGPFDGPFGGA